LTQAAGARCKPFSCAAIPDILMPHLHSSLGFNFSPGMTLTPAAYHDFFQALEPLNIETTIQFRDDGKENDGDGTDQEFPQLVPTH
jgi:hypothetical protein